MNKRIARWCVAACIGLTACAGDTFVQPPKASKDAMSNFRPGEPVPYRNLTPEELAARPRDDYTTLFSREEVLEAALLISSPAEAEKAVRFVYDELAKRPSQPIFFFGDILDALALTSPDAARRVQSVLNETDAQMQARIAKARRRWKVGGRS